MSEPVTLAQLKDQLRIYHTMQDTMLGNLITAARQLVEKDIWWDIESRTRVICTRAFPWGDEALLLPRPPLQSITSIQYVDLNGNTQTLSNTLYQVDTLHMPGSVEPLYGQVWPWVQDGPAGVTVTYVTGFSDPTTIDLALQQAILILAAEMYESSTPVEIKGRSTVDRLLEKYRIRELRMLECLWQPKRVATKHPGGIPLWNGEVTWW